MLTFGYLSDKVGRKFGMMTATGIVFVFSILSAASSGARGSVNGLLSMLSACRFLLGIGIGAEYPCGSVAASEQSEEDGIGKYAQHRGWLLLQVMFAWRYTMQDPPSYQRDSMKHARIPYTLIIRRYGVRLAAISIVWFLYDFIVYFGLYSTTVVNNVTGGSDSLSVVLGWGVVINLFYMPGTIGGAFVVDYIGAKNTLILGLLSQAVIGFIMSGLYKQLTNHIAAFAVVYGIFLSLGELGPGNCTFLLASKSCPTAVRGQFFGVAAAIGKVGAFIGTWAFPPMIDAFGGPDSARGNTGPFWVGSGIAILSAIITFFFVKPLDRDGMIEEDKQFREYLEANGYDTSKMGLGMYSESLDEAVDEKVAKLPEYSASIEP
ncbi:major facilitator superfamily domain-containing protein [Infundibulicybe gibba]|nr:major facilitator superfamily domain-containing protein [Infundibulicybe gibba]